MDDLKYIKTHYGEKMMKLCRDLFPTILETPGNLSKIMGECFHPSKSLYYDIVNNKLENQFEDYINKKIEIKQVELPSTNKTPFELMEEAGYKLYKCETEEEIQAFKRFYAEGEALCTFYGGRLESCHVFFAVKKEAERLRREDFKNPRRQDGYGTSVISIQFSRNNYTLSIKNRYNHTVDNPDATFGNNLENIIPGLTKSFEDYYGHEIKQNNENNFEIPGYIEVDGKFYKYNHEINNIYYCPNNIIIKNGEAITTYNEHQEQYIIMDYFILDLKEKTLTLLDETIRDGLVEEYKNIKKIKIKKEKEKKIIIITTKNGNRSVIVINNLNQIVEYENEKIKKMSVAFMGECKCLQRLYLPELRSMEHHCFYYHPNLIEIELPKLTTMGDNCFSFCKAEKIDLPSMIKMESGCFWNCKLLKELNLPKIEILGDECFCKIEQLKSIRLPKLQSMGNACFNRYSGLASIDLPHLKKMGSQCFESYIDLQGQINLPMLEIMGDVCFCYIQKLNRLYFPKLEKMGCKCFYRCEDTTEISIPNIRSMECECFKYSKIKKVHLPKLELMGKYCFMESSDLEIVNLPKLILMKKGCFEKCNSIKEFNIPKLKKIEEKDKRTSLRINALKSILLGLTNNNMQSKKR